MTKRSSLSLTLGPEQLIGSTPQESTYLLPSKSALLREMFPENEIGKSPFGGVVFF